MISIFVQYLEWHFLEASGGILAGWKNVLRFNLNYWSLTALLKTFFSHWRRYKYSYGRGFDLGRYFEVFVSNLMSRIIGAIMRSVLIVLGFLTEIFLILSGAVIFFIWSILPVLIIVSLWLGIKILF